MKMKTFYFAIALLLSAQTLDAQQLIVDRGIQAAGLWCFPVFGDSLTYRYLPSRGRLGLDKDSLPEFSFLRYITERPAASGANTITEAGGGGIVNFLVLYDTPERQIREAEAELKKRLNVRDLKIKGPVAFNKGRYILVSSILNQGKTEKEVLATGEAPILENSRIAFSFEVDPVRSKLLLESFKMKTPDISLMFELGFSGLTDSYQADLSVDWSEVRKSESFGAGASIYFVSADVEVGFDKLMRNGAIKLNTVGSNDQLDGLLNTVYGKLLDLMFKRVEPERVPADARGGLFDAIGALTGPNGPLGSRKTTGFGINVGYQLKELETTGKTNLFFRGRSTVERNHYVTFNIGDLYKKHGANTRMFRDIPLYDPDFQQRMVYVGVDGSLEKEFDKMVNNVTVKMRKKHGTGEETLKEVSINRRVYRDSTGKFKMIYLNRSDKDMTKWLEYEYQTVWQFVGGGTYVSDWTPSNAAMINLFAPFKRRQVSLEGDLEGLVQKGCRAVSVRIEYPFFSETRKDDRTLRANDNLNEKSFEVTLPLGKEEIDYNITWINKDGTRLNEKGKDKIGLIFIDELPQK
jgi:hypothetical protein